MFYAFPSVLLAIALSGTLGAGRASTRVLSLTIVFVPQIVRVAESVTAQVAQPRGYVEAARASGASSADHRARPCAE